MTEFQQDGPEAARIEWEAALKLVEQRLAERPKHTRLLSARVQLLAHLGRRDEAEQRLPALRQIAGMDSSGAWFGMQSLTDSFIALGRKSEAIREIRSVIANSPRWFGAYGSTQLRLDPAYDPLRGEPAFAALVAEVEARERSTTGPAKPAGLTAAGAAAAPDDKSVAVLAFANQSDDKANEYFSDGISEELLNVLGRVPGLRVAAPMSAFSFKGKNVPAREIGQKLNVAFLVNGSVRRAGPEIRVVARLSRADTDEQIWTEKFNGEAKNVFALQDEIAGKIAAALSLKLGASARAAKPIDPEAYRLYLEGRQFWSARSLDALDRAEVAFKGALQLEPDSALIHAGLAELYGTRALYRALAALPEAGDLNRASEQADRAVALDPKLVQGYVARATIAVARQNYPEAERLLRDSLALAPNDALALNRLGDALKAMGIDVPFDGISDGRGYYDCLKPRNA
jgi:TolB-like protein